MLAHGDMVGTDHAGRTLLQLAVDPWTLDQLCAFDAGSEDLEDSDSEPEPDQKIDSTPVMLDAVRTKRAGVALAAWQPWSPPPCSWFLTSPRTPTRRRP